MIYHLFCTSPRLPAFCLQIGHLPLSSVLMSLLACQLCLPETLVVIGLLLEHHLQGDLLLIPLLLLLLPALLPTLVFVWTLLFYVLL